MSENYNEDHPEEIHAGETPEELAGHDEAEAEARARAAEEKQKKDKKLKVILFGGVVVASVGYVGFKLMGGGAPAPRPTNVFPAVVQSPLSPSPALPAMGQAPAVAAATLGGGVGAPSMAPPLATPSTPPDLALPNTVPVSGALPAAGVSPSVPLAGGPGDLAMPSAVVGALPVPAPGSSAVPAVALSESPKPAVEGFTRGFDELAKKIDDLKSMFSKFDEMNIGDRLSKLEERVGALEGGKVAAKTTAASGGAATVVKKHYRAPRSATPQTVPLGQGEDLLFARIADPKQNSITTIDTQPRGAREQAQNTRSYALHAVIPNRIWIKGQDGTSQTFENGEMLPDGSKILKIDPDRGDVVTSKGVLKFDAR